MARVLEFIGPAGVGKSTVYRELRQQMGLQEGSAPRLSSAIDRIGLTAGTAALLLPAIGRSWFSVSSSRPGRASEAPDLTTGVPPGFLREVSSLLAAVNCPASRKMRILKALIVASRDYITARRDHSVPWHVFDELFCQRALSVAGRSPTPVQVASQFATLTPLPDIIVSIDAPSSEIVRRNIKRAPHKRISGYPSLDPDDLLALTELAKQIVAQTLSAAARRGTEVLSVSAMRAPADVARAILMHVGVSPMRCPKFNCAPGKSKLG